MTRENGRVLTAKHLSPRAYNAIHKLPRGYRQDSIKALLNAAATLAERDPEWYRHAVAGNIALSVTRGRG